MDKMDKMDEDTLEFYKECIGKDVKYSIGQEVYEGILREIKIDELCGISLFKRKGSATMIREKTTISGKINHYVHYTKIIIINSTL